MLHASFFQISEDSVSIEQAFRAFTVEKDFVQNFFVKETEGFLAMFFFSCQKQVPSLPADKVSDRFVLLLPLFHMCSQYPMAGPRNFF